MCLKEFVEAGAIAVRRCRKEDLRRIAKATGGTLVSSLANLEGDESFEPSYLGYAEEVVQERISDDELILVKGTKVVNSSSIVLRGANDYMLDEMERALHDTLSVIKRTLESGTVVPGGGAVETALSIYLENFATTLVSASCDWITGVLLSNNTIGVKGTTRHRRVCLRLACHPEDTRRQCREGLDRAGRKIALISQCRAERPCWRSEESPAEIWSRPPKGRGAGQRLGRRPGAYCQQGQESKVRV